MNPDNTPRGNGRRIVPPDVLAELAEHYGRGREVLDAAGEAAARRYADSLTPFSRVRPPGPADVRRLRNREARRVADRDLLPAAAVRAAAEFAELIDGADGDFCSACREFLRAGRLGLSPEAARWLEGAHDRDLIDLPEKIRSARRPEDD